MVLPLAVEKKQSRGHTLCRRQMLKKPYSVIQFNINIIRGKDKNFTRKDLRIRHSSPIIVIMYYSTLQQVFIRNQGDLLIPGELPTIIFKWAILRLQ